MKQRIARHRLRNAIFVLFLVVAFLGGVEGILRIASPHQPELRSPLPFQRIDGPIIDQGPVPGTVRYLIGRNPMALEQPVGHRIFVFGGSAAFGERFNQYVAFGGWIQRWLRLAFPDDTWEVINLAAGGLAARHVEVLVRQLVAAEHPDLLIIYSGNNEFHELRALKMLSPHFDARVELLRRRLSQFYLYRTLRDLLLPPPAPSRLQHTTIPTITDITAEVNEADRRLVTMLYRESLAKMVKDADGAKVPILLTTIADNLRDLYGNWQTDHLPPRVQTLLAQLETPALRTNRARLIAWVDAHDAELQYEAAQARVALALLRFNERTRARRHFERSEYLAPKPFRGNVALRQAAREVAETLSAPLCDTERELSAHAKYGIPGVDLFLDACHPNAKGHRLLAQILLRCMVQQGLLPLPGDADEQGRRLEQVFQETPLEDAHPWRLDHWTTPLNRDIIEHGPDGRRHIVHDGTALGATVAGHHAYVAEHYDLALALYEQALALGAPRGPLMLDRALTLLRQGKWEEAGAALEESARTLPDDLEIRGMLKAMGW